MNTVEAIAVAATALLLVVAVWATAVLTQQALIP
jgi:hypothetical protein